MAEKHWRHKSIGPFAPPFPSEVEQSRPEPMAVAMDKKTTNDAHMPTSAPMDAYDPEVARRYAQHPERMITRERSENRAAERPPGYSEIDERGYRQLTGEDEAREE